MLNKRRIALVLTGIFCLQLMLAAGCKKPPPPPPPPPPKEEPPPPPPPPRPSVSLSAEPSSIERGKSATLKWSSRNSTSASLNQGIGAVPTSGSREVFPTQSTTYQIAAKGAGGEASAGARVTVRVPPPPEPPRPTFDGLFTKSNIRDALFDYDKSDLRSEAESVLRSNASGLKDIFGTFAQGTVVVEGHCDERGTNEYNLALGDRRATASKDFLVNLGVPANRLTTISYGEERPQCTSSDENCWQRNRRAHFSVR